MDQKSEVRQYEFEANLSIPYSKLAPRFKFHFVLNYIDMPEKQSFFIDLGMLNGYHGCSLLIHSCQDIDQLKERIFSILGQSEASIDGCQKLPTRCTEVGQSWALIGQQLSRDQNRGFWLVNRESTLGSDWLMMDGHVEWHVSNGAWHVNVRHMYGLFGHCTIINN